MDTLIFIYLFIYLFCGIKTCKIWKQQFGVPKLFKSIKQEMFLENKH